MSKPKILVVGSLVMDLIVSSGRIPDSGETVIGMDFNTAPGGKGANQAIQAARLGAEVTMVGKVGNDDFGKRLIASAASFGLDTTHIMVSSNKPTATAVVLLEVQPDGSTANRIIVTPGSNFDIQLSDVEFLKEDISKYDMVMLQLEIPMEINIKVAEYAAAKGVPVMLNSAPYADMPVELLKNVTYISPNEHEAKLITGVTVVDDASTKEAVEKLMDLGVKNAIITLGSKGAVFATDTEYIFSPSVSGVKVADPTAAGDSFVGAFCFGVCNGLSYNDALVLSNNTAAITVSKMGAQPSLPSFDEVLDAMKNKGTDVSPFENLK